MIYKNLLSLTKPKKERTIITGFSMYPSTKKLLEKLSNNYNKSKSFVVDLAIQNLYEQVKISEKNKFKDGCK